MLNDLLWQLGLSEKEIAVYLAVLQSGRLSYTDLARKTGLNRTTTYSAAHALVERGLLLEDFSSPVKALAAAPPEALMDWTAREESAVRERKSLSEKAAAEARALPTVSGYIAPVIAFIPQDRIQRFLRERSPVWDASMLAADQTWWGFTDASFTEKYGKDWLPWYWTIKPKAVKARLFSNTSSAGEELMKLSPTEREIRPWPGEHVFTGCCWVAGEYVVTINVREKPHYAVEMRDRTLANNLRTVFSVLWEATNPKTK